MSDSPSSLRKGDEPQDERWASCVLTNEGEGFLFLGAARDAKDLAKLKENRISALPGIKIYNTIFSLQIGRPRARCVAACPSW